MRRAAQACRRREEREECLWMAHKSVALPKTGKAFAPAGAGTQRSQESVSGAAPLLLPMASSFWMVVASGWSRGTYTCTLGCRSVLLAFSCGAGGVQERR